MIECRILAQCINSIIVSYRMFVSISFFVYCTSVFQSIVFVFLLPVGQLLAPQNLAMGQTYEQLDKGEEGRLGKRGKETAPISAGRQ